MYYIKYDYLKDRNWLMCEMPDHHIVGYDIQHIHSFEWDRMGKRISLDFGSRESSAIITEQEYSGIYAYIIKLLNLE